MTFSDKRVVDLVKDRMIPVWESVAPVSIAVFDLGDGRKVKGTMGGEIALYFCRPDGKVFDILPALHSPHVTYWAIKNALDFYDKTGATDPETVAYHSARLEEVKKSGAGEVSPAAERSLSKRKAKYASSDGGTRALVEMTTSKTGIMTGPEPVTVVEPGGLEMHKRAIHVVMSGTFSLLAPQQWKDYVFGRILQEELKGGEFEYDVDTLAPISIIED
ncbi:MAG TPA: hypothetical protein VFS19_07530 [Planctomycetota bacterium]|nr:hypothetical protein [Planctomycetota bacterium]